MKHILQLAIILLPFAGICQVRQQSGKKQIDSVALAGWPVPELNSISSNGQYAIYTVVNPSIGLHQTFVQGLFIDYKISLPDAIISSFDDKGKQVVFLKSNDSLGLLTAGELAIQYTPQVRQFKLHHKGSINWLGYLTSDSSSTLLIKDLEDQSVKFKAAQVTDFFFQEQEGAVFYMIPHVDKDKKTLMRWDAQTGQSQLIWHGEDAVSFTFNKKGDKLAFIERIRTARSQSSRIILYSNNSIRSICDDGLISADNCFEITRLERFGNNDSLLYFKVKGNASPLPVDDKVRVDVWSHHDPKIQAAQLKDLHTERDYLFVTGIYYPKIMRLESESEYVMNEPNIAVDYMMVLSWEDNTDNEWNWNDKAKKTIYYQSALGNRIKIDEGLFPSDIAHSYKLSPQGDYVIYYNGQSSDYFSYEISTGKRRNLTHSITAKWTRYKDEDIPMARYLPINYAGWTEDNKILVYSQYDIFRLDPSGQKAAICLTNYLGQRKKLCLRFIGEYGLKKATAFEGRVVSAFDMSTKYDGYYLLSKRNNSDPEKLILAPCVFSGFSESTEVFNYKPVCARDSNVFIVRRMTVTEAPNLYATLDFRHFEPITAIQPHKEYYWLKTELIKYKLPNGKLASGILYLPENLDTTQKYPIIFHYYERVSDALHGFLYPEYFSGPINIPLLVSKGYLVFTPDFHYKVGAPGESVLYAIKQCVKELARKPYVDISKMGIQGHSRGGWETNYIVTHSNIFAAAMSSSGMSDYVSLYLGIKEFSTGVTRFHGHEEGYQRLGTTLWKDPRLYIAHSPIFQADRVTAPILLMNNKKDPDIPFYQGIEFFNALRRLGKKVWMLQYEDGRHMVNGEQAKDLTRRMLQFFDHYLKGVPAPRWIKEGVPAKMKNTEKRFELDN